MTAAGRTLWMGDLEPYMDEVFITQAYAMMGEVVSGIKLIKNKYTGAPQGYCFVEFADYDQAHKAMLRLNGKPIPGATGKRFKLNLASYGKEHLLTPEYSLFVGELTDDVDDFALYDGFSKRYQSVKAAKVVLDCSGHSKGYGFVRFTDETEQQKALIEMHHFFGIGKKCIRVSLATPKRSAANQMGPYSYQDYYQQYQSYYGQWGNQYGSGMQGTSQGTEGNNGYQFTEEEDTEDPGIEVDVDEENKEYMERSEELYTALESSRWYLLDNIMSKIPTLAATK